ncbi:hypothetical protein N0V90_009495, partial [Kalmusia sp. IMI 367209]
SEKNRVTWLDVEKVPIMPIAMAAPVVLEPILMEVDVTFVPLYSICPMFIWSVWPMYGRKFKEMVANRVETSPRIFRSENADGNK